MNDTLKQNFLKQLEVNTQIIINKFNSLNISVENTDYRGFITSIFDVSYLTNSGDIRNIDIFVNTIDENMKNKYFCVSLNDKSIGAGLYCSPKNKYGFSSLSSSWQTKSFDSLKTKELFILSSKNISHGTPIDFMVEIDTILEPLYKLFWRDEKFLINYYDIPPDR